MAVRNTVKAPVSRRSRLDSTLIWTPACVAGASDNHKSRSSGSPCAPEAHVNSPNELSQADNYALTCIRVHVQRLVAGNLVQSDEADDVCHTVYCDFLRRKQRYDPARAAFTTFTSTVVRNLVATVAEQRAEAR